MEQEEYPLENKEMEARNEETPESVSSEKEGTENQEADMIASEETNIMVPSTNRPIS
jgi:hypothetical protein